MQELEFHPELIGRDSELKALEDHLSDALDGKGSTVFVSGEAGIGKTRLLNELKQIAETMGFKILSGNSLYESMTPYMPIREALRTGGLEYLFAEKTPRVEAVYLVTDTGILVKSIVREDTRLDADIFSSTLATVADFVKESLSHFRGKEAHDTLNRIGYGEYVILIESGKGRNLVVILTGKENEFLIEDIWNVLQKIESEYGEILSDWDGDEEKVKGLDVLLKPIIESGKYDGTLYGEGNPEARRNLLIENVALGLNRLSMTAPILLCIDDLQWADPSTLALMHYIARNTIDSGVLILGAYRPEDLVAKEGGTHPLIDRMREMNREGLHESMELTRLPSESIPPFLLSLLGEVDFEDDFMARVHEETEGNPLFIIELMRLMIEEGEITRENGAWTLAGDIETVRIPSKVRDVISKRLDRVAGNERRVLDYASVIGEIFKSEILGSTLEIERVRMLEMLRAVEKTHRLIHPHNGHFRFEHSKIREVLYDDIPEELKREYHSAIAESISHLNEDNLDEVVEDLAFHTYRGRNKVEALRYLIKAADKCKRKYSNEEAIRFYNEALSLEEDSQKRSEILEGLGDVLKLVASYERGLECYNRALALTEDGKKKAGILVKAGEVCVKTGELEEAFRKGRGALSLVEATESTAESAAHNLLGNAYWTQGRNDEALESYLRGLKIAEKIGDRTRLAGLLNNIGLVNNRIGDYDSALKYLNKSVELSKECGNLVQLGNHLNNIGSVYMNQDKWEEALSHLRESLEVKTKCGNLGGSAGTWANIGIIYNGAQRYEEALECFDKSIRLSKKVGDRAELSITYSDIAETELRMENVTAALEHCNRAYELSKEIGSRLGEAASLKIFGIIHGKKREWKDSIRNFTDSIRLSEETKDVWDLGMTHREFGMMWKAKGDRGKAREHLDKALEIFSKHNVKSEMDEIERALDDLRSP